MQIQDYHNLKLVFISWISILKHAIRARTSITILNKTGETGYPWWRWISFERCMGAPCHGTPLWHLFIRGERPKSPLYVSKQFSLEILSPHQVAWCLKHPFYYSIHFSHTSIHVLPPPPRPQVAPLYTKLPALPQPCPTIECSPYEDINWWHPGPIWALSFMVPAKRMPHPPNSNS